MPTCEYCDRTVEAGTTHCPYCFAPLDQGPAQAEPARTSGGAPGPGTPPGPGPTTAPRPGGPGSGQGGGLEAVVQSIHTGDAGGVARGLQQMAGSGQLDLGKLAGDLGIGGGRGLDLGQIARSLTGGGSSSSQVLGAISRQSGGLGKVLGDAAAALKTPTGLAVGVGALAAAGVGAGVLIHHARKGGGTVQGTIDSLKQSVSGGLGSLLGKGGTTSDAEAAQYREIAEQLPAASASQLVEGLVVLARWDRDSWLPGRVGWVDGGRARITFENGVERWCDPGEVRLPPTAETPPQTPPPDPQAGSEAPAVTRAQCTDATPTRSSDDPFAGTEEDPFK